MNLLLIIIVILLDQGTKLLTMSTLAINEKIVIIDGFFQFNHVRNYGAAWSILENKQFLLIGVAAAIVGVIIYYKKKEPLTKPMSLASDLVLGGAIGNLIDRIRLGNVVDMIDFKFGNFYDYPVFNIADIAVVIGVFTMAYLVLKDKAVVEGSVDND